VDDFAEFYEASYGRLVALVAAMVGDRQQAEDIAQEAFARALTRWARVSARAASRLGAAGGTLAR
jgi:RNA polymerase sigma-70 factor, ECF subfamily